MSIRNLFMVTGVSVLVTLVTGAAILLALAPTVRVSVEIDVSKTWASAYVPSVYASFTATPRRD